MFNVYYNVRKTENALERMVINDAPIVNGSITIEIPSVINGCEIKKIGSSLFVFLELSKELEEKTEKNELNCINIKIPEGVTKITDMTIDTNTKIGIEIPSTVKKIRCRIKNIAFSDFKFAENSHISEIGYSFENCLFMKHFKFPRSLTNIDNECFRNCIFEDGFSFEEGSELKFIGYSAFQNCTITMKKLEIPEKVTQISMNAFRCIKGVEELNFSSKDLFLIGNSAFRESNLKKVSISGHGTFDYNIFENSRCLRSLNLKDLKLSLKQSIPVNFCSNCIALEEVFLPCNTQSIGSGAFKGTNLNEIIFPATLKIIGAETFAFSKLKRIRMADETKIEEIGKAAFLNSNLSDMPSNIIEYCESIGLKAFGDTLFETLTIFAPPPTCLVNDQCFSSIIKLKSLTLKNNLHQWKELVSGMFSENYKLNEITLPDSIEVLGRGCFKDSNIETFVAPEMLKVIKPYCFAGNNNLSKVDLSKSIKDIEINKDAFPNTKYSYFKVPFYMSEISHVSFENATIKDIKNLFLDYPFLIVD